MGYLIFSYNWIMPNRDLGGISALCLLQVMHFKSSLNKQIFAKKKKKMPIQ